MNSLQYLEKQLEQGKVYRRADLTKWSKSVDRHARTLVEKGVLKKLRAGTYYYPKKSKFGEVPAEAHEMVHSFLKSDSFLLTSQSSYNKLGMGTTQLYNKYVVYNTKRHGEFKLGNYQFEFRSKSGFPKKESKEFLLVDMLNNLPKLAEDTELVKDKVMKNVGELDANRLRNLARDFGKVGTKKFLETALRKSNHASA